MIYVLVSECLSASTENTSESELPATIIKENKKIKNIPETFQSACKKNFDTSS